jgi:hypothetical protein
MTFEVEIGRVPRNYRQEGSEQVLRVGSMSKKFNSLKKLSSSERLRKLSVSQSVERASSQDLQHVRGIFNRITRGNYTNQRKGFPTLEDAINQRPTAMRIAIFALEHSSPVYWVPSRWIYSTESKTLTKSSLLILSGVAQRQGYLAMGFTGLLEPSLLTYHRQAC